MRKLKKFDHQTVEKTWQKRWKDSSLHSPDIKNSKKPFYNLWMFPYPSAEGLHAGHAFSGTGSDVYGRYKRMKGKDVFQPIGYDSFGMHSENFAIKINEHPKDMLARTTKYYEKQLKSLGQGYDWTKTVTTSDIDYYRWTQWLFVQMFKAGLAYRKKSSVNWCPSCKTVLADEQVINGECERCGSEVQTKALEQWFFRITDYADKLLANLGKIDWPERIKIAQRNWIGRSEGAIVRFQIPNSKFQIETFTTRPDTLYGATFFVISPEHPEVMNITTSKYEKVVHKYVENAKRKSKEEMIVGKGEKSGVFTGGYVINPATKEKIPVFVADYILMDYGTGAVMGVPGHDERDFEFAKKFNLPIRIVVIPKKTEKTVNKTQHDLLLKLEKLRSFERTAIIGHNWYLYFFTNYKIKDPKVSLAIGKKQIDSVVDELKKIGFSRLKTRRKKPEKDNYFRYYGEYIYRDDETKLELSCYDIEKISDKAKLNRKKEDFRPIYDSLIPFTDEGIVIFGREFADLDSKDAGKKIVEKLKKQGLGEFSITYHLRDWLISRQRYWGPPIPMIYCQSCAKKGKSWVGSDEAKKWIAKFKLKSKFKKKVIGNWKLEIGNSNDKSLVGWYPVDEGKLPVELPHYKDYKPKGTSRGPLAEHSEFYDVDCPECGSRARRETDVSDTFVDSSWYFLRYPSVDAETATKLSFDPKITKKWLPVDLYFGGAEHSVLHLMYARFVTQALHDLGHIGFDEPFPRFYAHGLMIKDGAKMSKSRGNVVNPDEYIEKYGADTFRLYLMFMGPMDGYPDFRDTGIEGMRRFLEKVWQLFPISNFQFPISNEKELLRKMHQTIKKVTEDIDKFHYNTAISAIMEYVNVLRAQVQNSKLRTQNDNSKVKTKNSIPNQPINQLTDYSREALKTLALLLAPFAPHLAEEVWVNVLGEKFSIHKTKWPKYDPKYIKLNQVEIVVQVNGKLRSTINVKAQSSNVKTEIIKLAKEDKKVKKWLMGKKIKKEIFVPNKLVNFVVS